MIATLTALLLAHALADFVLQTDWMATNKRDPRALLTHTAIVLASVVATTGSLRLELLALSAAHLAIDLAKSLSGRRGLAAFLLDQAAHIATLIALCLYAPDLWTTGFWTTLPWAATPQIPALMALATGLILATRAGGFAIGMLMEPFAINMPPGLKNGGRAIGRWSAG